MVVYRRSAIEEPHVEGEGIGEFFKALAVRIRERMKATEDNCTIMCFGPTGSGKTTLGFHFGSAYNGGAGVNPDVVGLDKKSWAQALNIVRDDEGSFAMNDEANISKRDAMSQYNKDTIDLLFSIRGKMFCLWLNNPSLEMIDKPLVEEGLINFFIFISKKQKEYLLFTMDAMLKFLRAHGNLKFDTVNRYGAAFASWRGRFGKYSGADWSAYLDKKQARMDGKIDTFVKKYARGKRVSLMKAAKILDVSYPTARKYAVLAVEDGLFSKSEVMSIAGVWQFSDEHLDLLASYMEQKQRGEV